MKRRSRSPARAAKSHSWRTATVNGGLFSIVAIGTAATRHVEQGTIVHYLWFTTNRPAEYRFSVVLLGLARLIGSAGFKTFDDFAGKKLQDFQFFRIQVTWHFIDDAQCPERMP